MDEFKTELFFKEYGHPMEVLTLSKSDRQAVGSYALKFIGENGNEGDFFKLLLQCMCTSISVEDLNTPSALKNELQKLDLSTQKEVLVIWEYPHHVNKFNLEYLIKHWEDIWFPPSDDAVCLYFPETNEAILITHWGEIHY